MPSPQFNKRKSANKGETPHSAKKAKQENVTPNVKANQQKTPAKNNAVASQNKNSSGKKQKQVSPKTPKVNMFIGTIDLNISKKEAKNAKKLNQTPAKAKENKQKEVQSEVMTENQMNRKNRRRVQQKARRLEARSKIKQLGIRVRAGDLDARREVEEKIKEMESKPTKSNNCIRTIRLFKAFIKSKDSGNGSPKQKKIEAKKQQAKPEPKASVLQVENEESESDEEAENESSTNLVIENDSDDDDAEEGEEKEDEDEDNEDEEEEEDDDNEASAENDDDEDNEVSAGNDDDDDNEVSAENDDDDDNEASDDEEEEGEEENKNKESVFIKNKQNKQQNLKTNETNANKFDKEKKSRYVVFVGNLPYSATQDELREHFKKAGSIVDIRIPTDVKTKKPRGFAYVELQNEDSYQKALSLHHTSISGRRINVLYSEGGKKKGEDRKNNIRDKNFKLQGMRKQGLIKGSPRADQKRSARRAKQKQFEKGNSQ